MVLILTQHCLSITALHTEDIDDFANAVFLYFFFVFLYSCCHIILYIYARTIKTSHVINNHFNSYSKVDGEMDEWLAGWLDGWLDGRMNELHKAWMVG